VASTANLSSLPSASGSRSSSRLSGCNGAGLSNTASAGDHRLSARRLGRHHRASDESMAHRAARLAAVGASASSRKMY
jgi:hypothetical protein